MSTEPKMTPWFVNGEKPARPGVYEVQDTYHTDERRTYYGFYSKTTGWGCGRLTIEDAIEDKGRGTLADWYSSDRGKWRGLASKP